MKYPTALGAVVAVLCCTVVCFAADSGEMDRELRSLKKEITRVQGQRQREAEAVKKEREEFRAYQERTKQRKANIGVQTDSINGVQQQTQRRNDSLRAVLTSVQARIREQELSDKRIHAVIIVGVKKLQEELPYLPPLIRDQYEGPISYLLSELTAGSVESTEALYRMVRIVQDLRNVAREIQVVEGISPVTQLRGMVYRLRIGAIFEAIVDTEGRNAFLWTSAEGDHDSVWVPVDNKATATALLKAVHIREGTTVPELVELPLGMGLSGVKESSDDR